MPNIRGGTTKDIAAAALFTDGCQFDVGHGHPGHFALSGTWVATVYFQISFNGSTWLDVDSFTANTIELFEVPESGVYYRAGIKAGGYTSGTVTIRISRT